MSHNLPRSLTRLVANMEQWVSAYEAGLHTELEAPRIVFSPAFDTSETIDITDRQNELEQVSLLFPSCNLRVGQQLRSVLLPPSVCDIEFTKAKLNAPDVSLDTAFTQIAANLGALEFGWHIDGIQATGHRSHVTVAGSGTAKFIRLHDQARIREVSGTGGKVTPNEAERQAIEEVPLEPGTHISFQAHYDEAGHRYPDAHNFSAMPGGGRISHLITLSRLNARAVELFEKNVRVMPELTPYHPEEVAARVASYL